MKFSKQVLEENYRLVRQTPDRAYKYRVEYRKSAGFIGHASTKLGARWQAWRHWIAVQGQDAKEREVNW